MAGSLGGRIFLAISLVGLAILLTVGAVTFVVLRGFHADATASRLDDLSASILPQVREAVAEGNVRGVIAEIRDRLADDRIDVLLLGADGRLRRLDGSPVEVDVEISLPAADETGRASRGVVDIDGERYVYAATNLRAGPSAAARGLVFLTPDRTGALALADLGRAIPAVAIIVLAVGLPLAWLVSRSVGRPLRRVAEAAARLPAGRIGRLPLEGPREVQEVTATFNALADELAETRDREARLLADLRHDLRTPVTVIAGFAQALGDGTAAGPDAERAARAIAEEAGRLEALVGQLGLIERLRSGADGLRPEAIDLAELLASTVERFAGRAASAGIRLEAIAPGPASAPLVADRSAVDRILANLVANALASAPGPGGRVTLTAARTEIPARDGERPLPAVALGVADDGPGFPPGAAERAFERFFRADPSRSGPGSGLGLSIVRDLAEAHGGYAAVENLAPRGARVSVVLPLVATARPTSPDPTGGTSARSSAS
jgi:two-component system sensor histidine kinase BaeS